MTCLYKKSGCSTPRNRVFIILPLGEASTVLGIRFKISSAVVGDSTPLWDSASGMAGYLGLRRVGPTG